MPAGSGTGGHVTSVREPPDRRHRARVGAVRSRGLSKFDEQCQWLVVTGIEDAVDGGVEGFGLGFQEGLGGGERSLD
jgi:hypothetical protein